MQVRIWGARGSYPASGPQFSAFGHHTACISASAGDALLVLDAGSGAAALGASLSAAPVRELHVLLSHFHHDHLMGLPFLLYGAGRAAKIALHACFGSEFPLRETIMTAFGTPYFPAEFAGVLAGLSYHPHPKTARFALGDVAVSSVPLDHPGGSTAIGLKRGGKSLVYATDHETQMDPAPALVALARGVDLLIHDTMFTREEAATRRGWGHSTAEAALILAQRADIGRLAGFHHAPHHDDDLLTAREGILAASLRGAFMAREGASILL